MPRTAPLSPVTIAGLIGLSAALGGCGSSDPQLPTDSQSTGTRQASFPLTVSRQGGVAGFSDTLSIQDDGAVLAATKQGRVTCTIDKASLTVLNKAALEVTADVTGPAAGRKICT